MSAIRLLYNNSYLVAVGVVVVKSSIVILKPSPRSRDILF